MDRTKICAHCNKKFLVPGRGEKSLQKSKYCSSRCQVEGRKKRAVGRCSRCGKPVEITPSMAGSGRGKYCSKSCMVEDRRSEFPPYKGKGIYLETRTGYLRLSETKKLLHVQIFEDAKGTKVLPGQVIHHRDGNKLNNDVCNLQLLPNIKVHARIHALKRLREAGGIPHVHKICGRCKQVLPKECFSESSRTWDGLFGWCRECHNKNLRERYEKAHKARS